MFRRPDPEFIEGQAGTREVIMSLYCDETERDIEYGSPLMAGTRGDVEFYSALSQDVLGRIPESEKRPTPCEPGDGGMDIHEASSSENFNGSYTISDFTLGEFRFSISRETAEKYLPKHSRRYPATVPA